MRALGGGFFDDLGPEGKFGKLVERVRRDKDLDLEFRGDYINIYYQGHSILNLKENGNISINKAFKENGFHKILENISDIDHYLKLLPCIKDNVSCYTKRGDREIEFEQLLIRVTNRERGNNSEYIILDRQYKLPGYKDRWDLIALKYPSGGRRKPHGCLSIIELKYGLNPDISGIKDQVEGYSRYLEANMEGICSDMEKVFEQKLKLSLIERPPQRIKWFNRKDFHIVQDIESTEIVIYLCDYNPKSKLRKEIEIPSYRGKVRIVQGGLALWGNSCTPGKSKA